MAMYMHRCYSRVVECREGSERAVDDEKGRESMKRGESERVRERERE